jgi:hypothetical protein
MQKLAGNNNNANNNTNVNTTQKPTPTTSTPSYATPSYATPSYATPKPVESKPINVAPVQIEQGYALCDCKQPILITLRFCPVFSFPFLSSIYLLHFFLIE